VIAAKRALATQEDLLRAITNENYASLAGPRDDMPLLNPEPASEDTWVTTAMAQNASLIASRMASDIAHDSLLTAYGGHLPTINVNVSRNWALEHGNFNNVHRRSPIGEAALIGSINGLPTVWIPAMCSGRSASRCRCSPPA
jgi:outer membrane protein TolC